MPSSASTPRSGAMPVMAASALTTLPTLLLFLPLQARLASGLAAGSVKQ